MLHVVLLSGIGRKDNIPHYRLRCEHGIHMSPPTSNISGITAIVLMLGRENDAGETSEAMWMSHWVRDERLMDFCLLHNIPLLPMTRVRLYVQPSLAVSLTIVWPEGGRSHGHSVSTQVSGQEYRRCWDSCPTRLSRCLSSWEGLYREHLRSANTIQKSLKHLEISNCSNCFWWISSNWTTFIFFASASLLITA